MDERQNRRKSTFSVGRRLFAAPRRHLVGGRHRVGISDAETAGLAPSIRPFDPFPYPVLSLVLTLEAVLVAAFVLMKQNRMSKIADRRAHLDLQINLMTERETTKIIAMLLQIGERLDIQHKVLDEESRQLSRLLAIETLIDTVHSKLPDE